MKATISTLFLFFVWLTIKGQTVEPSVAIEKRMLQFELESLYLIEKEDADQVNSWSIPSVLMRFGLSNSVEFQCNIPFVKETIYEDNRSVKSRTFLDKMQIGVSVNLWKERGVIPEAALMARVLLPIYEPENYNIGKLLALNFSNNLTETVSLNYNVGWLGEEDHDSFYYITNCSWEISPVVHSFIEFFGSTHPDDVLKHNINTGIGFNLGELFCLDLSVASGLNNNMMFFGGVLTYQLLL